MLRSRMTVILRRTVIALAAGVALGVAVYLPTEAMAFGHGGGGMGGFHGGMGGFHGGMGGFHGGMGGFHGRGGDRFVGDRFGGHRFDGDRFDGHRFFHHRFFGRRFFGPGFAFGGWDWDDDGCWVWTPYGYRSVCY
jgi:hypothetical protein